MTALRKGSGDLTPESSFIRIQLQFHFITKSMSGDAKRLHMGNHQSYGRITGLHDDTHATY